MENWLSDLQWGLRRAAREKGFTAVAVLTLALGIGANTAIFSVVDGALLRPLSYSQPEQLLSLHASIPQFAQKYPLLPVNYALSAAWRRQSRTLSDVGLMRPDTADWSGAGATQQITVARVGANIFRLLGSRPRLGRDFLPDEDLPAKHNVAVLTDAFWRSQFHADPGVVGRTMELDGHAVAIVGVMPPDFRFLHGEEWGPLLGEGFPHAVELFEPLGLEPANQPIVGNFNFAVLARMRPRVRPAQVVAELDVLTAAALQAGHAPPVQINVVATPLRDQIVGSHRRGLWLLLAAVGAILVIVCLNLAGLLLVRVQGRSHETAIRMALGANRARIARGVLMEGVALGVAGGGLGVLAAVAGVRWLVHRAPAGIPRLAEIHVSAAALGVAWALAVGSGLAFSLGPAVRGARTPPQAALRGGGRGSSEGGRGIRGRETLVAGQCALTAVLLAMAGLLAGSYWRLMRVNTGFEAAHALQVEADWSAGSLPRRQAFFQAAQRNLAALPGVEAAGLTDTAPLSGTDQTDLLSYPHDTRPLVERSLCFFSGVGGEYFSAMGIPILQGRTFTPEEVVAAAAPAPPKGAPATAPVAAVVSAATAAAMWPGHEALGQEFNGGGRGALNIVVGVAGDVRQQALETPPELAAYLPYTDLSDSGATFVLRTAADPMRLAAAARAAVARAEPAAAISQIQSLEMAVAGSAAPRRFQMELLAVFAVVALFLASLGIYGVVAYNVARRRVELGVRMALGAPAADVFRLVIRRGMAPVLVGLGAGLAAAVASGRLVGSLLFGVRATDPATLGAVMALIPAVALLACALPALRAARIDPVIALRGE